MKKYHSGFTLLELLIVIAIIGIIATIIIASLGGAQSKAKDSKALSQLSSMRTQAELFRSTHGSYGPNTTSCDLPDAAGTLFDPAVSDSLGALINGLPSGYAGSCYVDPDVWAVAIYTSDGEMWCAESRYDRLVTPPDCWIH